MENIKLFTTTALKNTFENSSHYLEPYVSLDDETNKVSYNIQKSIIKITVAQGKTASIYHDGPKLKSGINIIDTHFKPLDEFYIDSGRSNIKIVDLSGYKGTEFTNNCFSDYDNLSKIILSDNFTTIGENLFSGCYLLNEIVIKSSIPSITLKKIIDEIISPEKIYVPQDAVQTYKTAPGWERYVSMIKPIEE